MLEIILLFIAVTLAVVAHRIKRKKICDFSSLDNEYFGCLVSFFIFTIPIILITLKVWSFSRQYLEPHASGLTIDGMPLVTVIFSFVVGLSLYLCGLVIYKDGYKDGYKEGWEDGPPPDY